MSPATLRDRAGSPEDTAPAVTAPRPGRVRLRDSLHRRLPVNLVFVAVFVVLLWLSARAVDADPATLVRNGDQMLVVLQKLLRPDWTFLPTVIPAIAETVQMAIAGTFIGVVFAVPVAFCATTEVSGRAVTLVCRAILNVIRTIPDMLLAAIFVALFGIGAFTGMLAIAVFTFGMVSKLVYESIDSIDRDPIEAFHALGATRGHVSVHAVLPQVRSNIMSYALYALEINVRSSTVLGYIGAGGIGVTLQASMSLLRYDRVSVIVIAIFAVVLVIDLVSSWARRRLL